MLHSLRQQAVFPGHPFHGQRRGFHHAGVEVCKLPSVIGLENILQAGDRLEQQFPVFRLRHGRKPRQKLSIHPLSQQLCIGGGVVEKRSVIGRLCGNQQPIENQAQPQKGP